MLDDSGTQGHLNTLNGRKEQLAQCVVKLVECNGILKCGTCFELVSLLVGFHRTQVGSKAKITNLAQNFCGQLLVVNNETLCFQPCYLVGDAKWLFGVDIHIVRK